MDRFEERERTFWQKLCKCLSDGRKVLNITFVYLPIVTGCVVCLSYANHMKEEHLKKKLTICISLICMFVCFRIMYIFALIWMRFRENSVHDSPELNTGLARGRGIRFIDETLNQDSEDEQTNREQEFDDGTNNPPEIRSDSQEDLENSIEGATAAVETIPLQAKETMI